MEFDAGIEAQEQRLGDRRYSRGVCDVHDEDATPFPISLREVHCQAGVTLRNLATQAAVKLHDRQMQRPLRCDEAGLTLLAYALPGSERSLQTPPPG